MRERVSAVLAATMLCVAAIAAQTPPTTAPPAGSPPPGAPQGPPPKPKNLKVLPKDIDHDQLIAIMRGFSGALGVSCTYCHVGQESDPRSMDFASDDKDEKKAAREMLKMTETINADYVRKISDNDPDANVMCLTCHRGQKHPPRPLDAILTETVAKEGVDAAIAKYKQLRAESTRGRHLRLSRHDAAERGASPSRREEGRSVAGRGQKHRRSVSEFCQCCRRARDGARRQRRPGRRKSAVRSRAPDRPQERDGRAGPSAVECAAGIDPRGSGGAGTAEAVVSALDA